MSITRPERILLGAAAILATAIPASLYQLKNAALERLEPALSERLGTPVTIGDVDAELSGLLVVRDVSIDGLLRVDRIDAGLDLPALASGEMRLGLLEVHRPYLALRVNERGESNLEEVLRAARSGGSREDSGGKQRPLPHVRVSGGALVVELDGVARLEAQSVELTPVGEVLRLVAGPVEVEKPSLRAHGQFERIAADLHPRRSPLVGRAVARGGDFSIGANGAEDNVRLGDVIVSYGVGDVDLTVAGEATHRRHRGEFEVAVRRDPGGLLIEADTVELPLALAADFQPWVMPEGHATAELSLLIGARTRFELSAHLVDMRIRQRALASEPFALDLGVRLSGETWSGEAGRQLVIDGTTLQVGSIRLSGHGDAAWSAADVAGLPTQIRGELALTALGCDEALASLPASWRSAVAGLDLEGEIEGSARLHFDATAPEAAALGLDIRNRCRAAVDPIAARAREETPRTSLQDLPSHVPEAFVAAEDGRFFRHHGFDKRQIEQSLIANLQAGAIRRGGSTITQQLAKNLFLHHRRTFSRKLQEALIAWRLEHALDKQEILERYLSIVQLSSDGVTGIEDGARHWFGVSARRLSLEQAAFLAAITPEPTTMGARLDRAGGLDPTSQLRIDQVLRAMRRDGYITARELRRADPSALRLRRLEHASR